MLETPIKRINSPAGVSLLMENLWLRHKAGLKQRRNNIFMVDLPEPTEEEKRKMASNRASRKPNTTSTEALTVALEKSIGLLGGW